MSRTEEIYALAHQLAAKATADSESWKSFLRTAAYMVPYAYPNQLLIWAQRPDATACATIEYWNRQGARRVNQGSRGIAILDRRSGQSKLQFVFDLSDTSPGSGTPAASPWMVDENNEKDVWDHLFLHWTEEAKPYQLLSWGHQLYMEQRPRLLREFSKVIPESELEGFDPEHQQEVVRQLLRESLAYMAAIRLHMDPDRVDVEEFRYLEHFDTQRSKVFLGNALRVLAKPMMQRIGSVVHLADSLAKKRALGDNGFTTTDTTQTDKEEKNGLHLQGRLSDPEPDPGQPADAADRQVRPDAPGLSGGERPGDLRRADPVGQAVPPSAGSGADGEAADRSDDGAAECTGPGPGPQDRPAGLDAASEQPAGTGRGDGPADFVRPVSETTQPNPETQTAESEKSLFAVPFGELLPYMKKGILCQDGFDRPHNAEIMAFFAAHPDMEQRAAYLRQSYGESYCEFDFRSFKVGYHKEADGLLLYRGSFLSRESQSRCTWPQVCEIIAQAIEEGTFLAPEEKKAAAQAENGQLSWFGSETGLLAVEPAEKDAEAPHSVPEEEIRRALQAGSGFSGGIDRITAWFSQQHTEAESAEWLKKEYGTGGRSWEFLSGARGWLDYDASGFSIRSRAGEGQPEQSCRLKWSEAAQRIRVLVETGQYPEKAAPSTDRQAEQDKALQMIWDFCEAEYGQSQQQAPADLHHVPIAYGSTEDEAHTLQVEADLLDPAMRYLLDDQPLHQVRYADLNSLMLAELAELHYDTLLADALAYAQARWEEERKQNLPDDLFAKECLIPEETEFITGNTKLRVKEVNFESHDVRMLDITNGKGCVLELGPTASIAEVRRWMDVRRREEVSFADQVVRDAEKEAAPYRYQPVNYQAPYHPEVSSYIGQKLTVNMRAIRVLKQVEQRIENGGTPATPEEQEKMAGYYGWGGITGVFEPVDFGLVEDNYTLHSLLTEEEYKSARSSTLTAFYTPAEVVHPIYRALERMGVTGGNILDPAMGTGIFFACKPSCFDQNDARLYGVELDSITGRIARQLYQKANIQVTGYENADLPDNFFDCAVGNVPFGDYSVSDRAYDKLNFRIHDYFLAKTVDKLRTGGIMAVITSTGTMDKKSETVRRYLAARCELIGAVRLPCDTFRENAGTSAAADILFLQKRDRICEKDVPWLHLGENGEGFTLNQYYVDHPEMVCGKMCMTNGPYGPKLYFDLIKEIPLEEQLDKAMSHLHATLPRAEILPELAAPEETENTIPAEPGVRNFSFTLVQDKLYYRENSIMREMHPGKTARQRICALIALRDTVRGLLQAQLDDAPDAVITRMQDTLNRQYDAYRSAHGLISSRSSAAAFGDDSSYFLLCSLEDIDEDGNFRGKTDLFTKRTVRAARPVEHVDTASDALALSIGEKARVDMDYMCSLTGKTSQQLCRDLAGVIFRDPEQTDPEQPPVYLPADEYLSGNVRDKLARARLAARADEAYLVNVQALEQVQPKDLEASEIAVRLGATWIPAETYKQFMDELIEAPYFVRQRIQVNFVSCTGVWNISNKALGGGNIRATMTYGTQRASFYRILEESLNLRAIRIFDTVEDADGTRKSVLNARATQEAQEKQRQIEEAFQEWVFQEQSRRAMLVQLYNEKFNSIRPREYDGSHINFVGMNPEITLRPHQRNAVAHILYGGNTLLAHVVGAGKSFEMVAAAMEKKRLGLCSKTMIAVPNHLTEQLASEALLLYPNARILVATRKDFEKSRRKRFCSKIATGDYDIIVIGHSQFEKIPLSAERQQQYLEAQIDTLIRQTARMKEERAENFTVKQMERMRKQLERRLDKLVNSVQRDDVVTFEELGVDSLMVDEAHNFKNMACVTKMRNVAGINQTESQKASDLLMKCMYLDEITAGRGITFATGTPISNSMTEMYTMMRYLQFHTLQEKGIDAFDSWASTFGETVTAIELAPEGTGYRTKTRFAKFYNLPELMSLFKLCADVQTADMLKLPVPELTDGKPIDVALEPSQLQKDMVAELGERAEQVRNGAVDPTVDNMLRITSDGRKLALDQRLMDPDLPDDPGSKVNACVERVFDIWQKTAEQKSTQLIFCDLSTPRPDTFNVYDDIREKLVAKGIPKEEIQFIHDAGSEAKKTELFGRVRSGRVRILMGSTAKMGAGTNVQRKLIALHHLDVPWRPSDIEQREGRMVRQGNENKTVSIFRYVTRGTFDAYSWGIIENKQRFIGQIMTSKSPARSCDDMDDSALSYAEVKALAAGNPLIKEKMDLDVQLTRLRTLKAAYTSQHYRLEDALAMGFPKQQQALRQRIENAKLDLDRIASETKRDDAGKEIFSIQLDGKTYAKREEAGRALLGLLGSTMNAGKPVELGRYLGFTLQVAHYPVANEFHAQLVGAGLYDTQLGADAVGNMTRLHYLVTSMEQRIGLYQQQLETLDVEITSARAELKKPFLQEAELAEKSRRLAELDALLNMNQKESVVEIEPEAETAQPPSRPKSMGQER